MNAHQWIRSIVAAITISVFVGQATLWAGDKRYLLKQEGDELIARNIDELQRKEIEWLETLASADKLTGEQRLKLSWLKRQLNRRWTSDASD